MNFGLSLYVRFSLSLSSSMESTSKSPVISTKLFADVVGKTQSSSISLKSPSTYRGEPAMFFTEKDIDSLPAPFKMTLVYKFSHGRPLLPKIRETLESFGMKVAFTAS